MKLAVFGATGRVGSQVVKLALEEGWEVVALVRDEEKAKHMIKGASRIVGDVTNPADVKKTLIGCHMVFSGLSTDKTDTLSKAIPSMIKAMKKEEILRIVTIGTAGILNSRYEKGKYRFQTSESKRKKTFAAEEHVKVYEHFSRSNLDWTIVCPTYLPDGEEQGNIRYEIDYLPIDGKKITVDDTAKFTFECLRNFRFSQKRVGICY
ncbi:NAD(P)-dependent oxidoreductase [Halobacillus mangrovi]|uniref:NAD(P)-dependent oxidoreductase n=1 Tax=Halobacillus mangrovi TaxID=402384 RepID=UPI003D96EB27